jgi:hypothetical protein
MWMGPGRHFVHYFVSAERLINFVAVTEEESWLQESWVDRGEVADVLAAFAGWHTHVLSIIGAVDETYKWALFDRSSANCPGHLWRRLPLRKVLSRFATHRDGSSLSSGHALYSLHLLALN